MTESEIMERLQAAEAALDRGEGVGGTGFWSAVAAVKKSPELVERLGPRIADIDRRAFERWPTILLSTATGTSLAGAGTAVGLGGIVVAYSLNGPWNWIVFGAGTVALLGATHGLGHLVVGKAMGMRFTHWYMASVTKPQPGVKLDYATYLRTPPRQRAWMHAAGALVTKVIPFALIPAAVSADLPSWFPWLLTGIGLAAVVTDVVWSTKASDWSKFRREMGYAPPN